MKRYKNISKQDIFLNNGTLRSGKITYSEQTAEVMGGIQMELLKEVDDNEKEDLPPAQKRVLNTDKPNFLSGDTLPADKPVQAESPVKIPGGQVRVENAEDDKPSLSSDTLAKEDKKILTEATPDISTPKEKPVVQVETPTLTVEKTPEVKVETKPAVVEPAKKIEVVIKKEEPPKPVQEDDSGTVIIKGNLPGQGREQSIKDFINDTAKAGQEAMNKAAEQIEVKVESKKKQ